MSMRTSPLLAGTRVRRVHTSTDDTRQLLRELLRETAQSVAVVTTILPDRARRPSTSDVTSPSSTPTYHGATLSSFASIALDPHPLVAFSLRVPSRMASALNAHAAPAPSPSPSSSLSHPSSHTPSVHLIINILSAAQPHLADRFARPDLHPRPFADLRGPWTLSDESLPILSGALGALSCRLVGPSFPLARLRGSHADDGFGQDAGGADAGEEVQQASGGRGLASELFIARVLRVERVPSLEGDAGLQTLPLLYHRRRYTTVQDHTKS